MSSYIKNNYAAHGVVDPHAYLRRRSVVEVCTCAFSRDAGHLSGCPIAEYWPAEELAPPHVAVDEKRWRKSPTGAWEQYTVTTWEPPRDVEPTAEVSAPAEPIPCAPELVCVLDTETTGLRPTARVCEIAVAVIDLVTGATVKRASMLLNPGVPIPPDATRVHGITDAMVESAPRFMEAWPRVVSFIATHCPGLDVIAHNAPFDRGVLCDDLERAGEMSDAWPRWRWRDSVTLARQVIPGLPTYSLHDNVKGAGLASRLGLPKGGHRAMGDVRTTAALMVELRRRAQKPWGEWAGDAHVWGVGVVKAARAKPTATQQVQPTKRTSRGARSVDAVDAADAAPVVADLFARRSA